MKRIPCTFRIKKIVVLHVLLHELKTQAEHLNDEKIILMAQVNNTYVFELNAWYFLTLKCCI